ncbi:hypothetical protein DFQ04_2124 [Algoriphagus boseongensis]|uniref:DUF6787 domain-containing protein n=2 Tax=Algoriphagus boseongensis TaxID=1442587 RepID=A0A4V3D291_9BACT|nr:hypothetical protein DFQ04_2124 [Algoriphagus boseongensis]
MNLTGAGEVRLFSLESFFLLLGMQNEKPGFLQRLQSKWKLESIFQVVMVLVVFACTGFTILFIKNPILNFFGVERGGGQGFLNTLLYLLLVLPLYQIFLLIYGFIFGQFNFFWEKEKQIFRRIGKLFGKKGN